MAATDDERNAAYRMGLCVGLCGLEHSAGRTRCEDCHAEFVAARNEGRVP
ncbi:uncharacterized protein RMCB_6762 [Mycolicibacterium brisbanense]|uniref:Uncharacterized protein n=1 Tax=Mycolicibacterium brisbanense TaxID=146020 RepID=A0A100W6N4_9MYCO|nr:uncharacterized protein RMCB_6762 [Mycolicibacterium brisbanense]